MPGEAECTISIWPQYSGDSGNDLGIIISKNRLKWFTQNADIQEIQFRIAVRSRKTMAMEKLGDVYQN